MSRPVVGSVVIGADWADALVSIDAACGAPVGSAAENACAWAVPPAGALTDHIGRP